MTDQDAMKLALEALENSIDLVEEDYANAVNLYGKYPSRAQRLIGMETMRDDHLKAITALREALAAQPAMPFVPDAIHHTDTSKTLEYIQGWNDCRAAMLEQHPSTVENNGGKTGWPPGLLQDDCKGLSKWLSKQPDARRRVREALAEQPAQQEPVAWRWLYNGQPDSEKHFSMPGPDAEVISLASACEFPRTVQYLYTSPPAQRKPLTDEEIEDVWQGLKAKYIEEVDSSYWGCCDFEFARAIEAAHGIKENT